MLNKTITFSTVLDSKGNTSEVSKSIQESQIIAVEECGDKARIVTNQGFFFVEKSELAKLSSRNLLND